MIKKLLLILIISNLTISCGDKNNADTTTVISGQVINPKSDYILLSTQQTVTDTIQLDENGFFTHSFDQSKEGLYRIIHKEFQYVYLHPGDSLVLRVNTLEFDESLAFSGVGAAKNNFLINEFLNNETFNTQLPEHFKLNPIAFEKVITAEKEKKKRDLKAFKKSKNPSKGFLEIAQSNIDYHYYSEKELYTSNKNAAENDNQVSYPKDFYDYRNDINFNNADLANYYAYYSFLNRYFDNIAFEKLKKEVPDTQYNKESFKHIQEKLNLIDRTVKDEYLHNHILTSTVRRYLLNAENSDEENQIIELYNSLDRDKDDQNYIKLYAENSARINAGNKVSDLMLVNLKNESVMLSDITKQHTVLYFWSSRNIKHVKEIHIRIAELKSKFPEYHYIGINTDEHFKNWKKIVQNSGYNDAFEFQFENAKLATNELLINSNNKAIIIDKDGTILEGNSHIFNQNFEGKLLGFLNK